MGAKRKAAKQLKLEAELAKQRAEVAAAAEKAKEKKERREAAQADWDATPPRTKAITTAVFLLLVAAVIGGLAWMGNRRNTPPSTRPVAAAVVDEPDPPVRLESDLSTSAACEEFFAITEDLSLDDAALVVRHRELARATADPALGSEIRAVADAFARGQAEISSAGVVAAC